MAEVIKQDVIIVDENDNVIGYKKRGTILQEDIFRVSALMVKNSDGEFLLTQRAFTKKNDPGEWSLTVAGTIDMGETYDLNIAKEIEEEIGVKDIEYKKIAKKRIYGKHNFFVQFYIVVLDEDLDFFTIQKEEVEAIRWFTKEEILKGSFDGNLISKTLLNELDLFI